MIQFVEMKWSKKSEFNDPTVWRHRQHAKKRPPREAAALPDILALIVENLEKPVDIRVSLLRDAWPKLAGRPIADHSTPGFIKDFALHVFVDLPGWIPELERIKRFVLQKIQVQYPKLRIRKINFLLEHKK